MSKIALAPWPNVDPRIREIAERALTDKELEAFKMRLAGLSYRAIARACDIALGTACDRINRAHEKFRVAIGREGVDLSLKRQGVPSAPDDPARLRGVPILKAK